MLMAVDVHVFHIELFKQVPQLAGGEIVMRQTLFGAVERDERTGLNLVERGGLVLSGRHRDEDETARFQNPGQLADEPSNCHSAGMVDYLNGDDRVEERVGVGQRPVDILLANLGLEPFGGEPFTREPYALGRTVQSVNRETGAGEVDEMSPASTSEIEHTFRVLVDQQSGDLFDAFVDVGEDTTALDVDPVPGIATAALGRSLSFVIANPAVRHFDNVSRRVGGLVCCQLGAASSTV